jgi:hypothetical protein
MLPATDRDLPIEVFTLVTRGTTPQSGPDSEKGVK